MKTNRITIGGFSIELSEERAPDGAGRQALPGSSPSSATPLTVGAAENARAHQQRNAKPEMQTEVEIMEPTDDDSVADRENTSTLTETCAHGVPVDRDEDPFCQACENEFGPTEHTGYCSNCGMDNGPCWTGPEFCCIVCTHHAFVIGRPRPAVPESATEYRQQKQLAREKIAAALTRADGPQYRDDGYKLMYIADYDCPGGFDPEDLLDIARQVGLTLPPKMTPQQMRQQIIDATAGRRADQRQRRRN